MLTPFQQTERSRFFAAIRKTNGKCGGAKKRLVTFWVPKRLASALALAARQADADKSKFVRHAIREKLARAGIIIEEAA